MLGKQLLELYYFWKHWECKTSVVVALVMGATSGSGEWENLIWSWFLRWRKGGHLPFRFNFCSVHFNTFLFWHQCAGQPGRDVSTDFKCIEIVLNVFRIEQLQRVMPEPRPPSSDPEHLLTASPEHQCCAVAALSYWEQMALFIDPWADASRKPCVAWGRLQWPGTGLTGNVCASVWSCSLACSCLLASRCSPCACTSCLGN